MPRDIYDKIITNDLITNTLYTNKGITLKKDDDKRTSPSYYSRLQPQTIERLQNVLTPEEFQGFCRGNILKYAERMRYKDDPIKEANKIEDYAKWLVDSLNGDKVRL